MCRCMHHACGAFHQNVDASAAAEKWTENVQVQPNLLEHTIIQHLYYAMFAVTCAVMLFSSSLHGI